jgi:hypothetical protein
MAAKPARVPWERHELVTKAIFEALLKQSNAENLEVKHNVTIKGVITTHQIDVFWKFCMGGVDHSVIVQVKKQKGRAKKGDLLLFRDVLDDIPGQPRGIFVSEHGYQKGALEVARAAGIEALEIREVSREAPRDPITMTHLSIAFLTQRPDKVALEWVVLRPEISDLRVSLDPPWVAQHPEAEPGNVATTTTIPGVLRFLDADGNERTSMQKLVQDRIREFGQEGQTALKAEFPDPTYMSGAELLSKDGIPVGNLKIVRLTATLDIIKTTVTVPLFSPRTATYLFKKAIESDHRYVLVAQCGSDLVAEVSVPLRSFRIG